MSLEEERRDAADRRTNDLIGEFDAQVWAKVWLEIIEEHPERPDRRGHDDRLVRERAHGRV